MKSKYRYLAAAAMTVAILFSSRGNAQNNQAPNLTISGATTSPTDSNYFIIQIPTNSSNITVTVTANGGIPAVPTNNICTNCSNSYTPATNGSAEYTYTSTSPGSQDANNGPNITINVSSATQPKEYTFQVTKVTQSYESCTNPYTGGASPNPLENTMTSSVVTLLVYQIKTETVATTPSDRRRTTLGIGEKVKFTVEPAATSVNWTIPTGDGSLSSASGTTTTLTASQSPGSSTVRAALHGCNADTSVTTIAPSGLNSAINIDVGLGAVGPPNNSIGVDSVFVGTVLPTNVSFYNASFRENIPGDSWTWPNGNSSSRPPETVTWSTSYDNKSADHISDAPAPISSIFQNGHYVDFSYSVRVPQEYNNKNNTWISWFSGETHPRNFRGSNQQARAEFDASNVSYGGWMGPWQ